MRSAPPAVVASPAAPAPPPFVARRSFPAPRAWGTLLCWAALWGIAAPAGSPAAEPVPAPSPQEAAAREWVKARIHFQPFVFAGEAFPGWSCEPESAAETFLGKHERKATFWRTVEWDVDRPAGPGAYTVQMEFTSKDGRRSARWATIYKLVAPLPPDAAPTLAELAKAAGLELKEVEREKQIIEKTIAGRKGSDLVLDPQFARLLAGLHDYKEGKAAAARLRDRGVEAPLPLTAAARRNEDPFALDRHRLAWIKCSVESPRELRRKRSKLLGDLPRKRTAPAPTVREGTLAEAGMKPDAAEKIDAACKAWAADTDQGFSICVVRKGVVVIHRAYGLRDGRPMTLEDKSWMASVTKTTTAVAAMMLVERGLFALDDPVSASFPPLAAVKLPAPPPTPLTWRHCLTHTAGLSTWPLGSDESADLGERAADALPFVRPGEVWAYNGQSYSLAWKAMEQLTGRSLPTFQLLYLLRPLGMDHTDVVGAHADMVSTPMDMARYGQMLLNRGSYGEWEFFRPETFEAMLPQKLVRTLGPDAVKTFGIGLDGAPGSGKFGHGAASAATFSVHLDDELVVVMCRDSIGKNFDKYNGGFWKAIETGIDREAKPAEAK